MTLSRNAWRVVAGGALAVASVVGVQAAFSGAIYTSLSDGTSVNANVYPSKASVFLNGGPQNTNGSGLPDGVYVYQVTDPSGAVLLSTDDITCRTVQVAGGVVSGTPPGAPPCTHPSGTQNPVNGSIPVALMPFADTPNNGGEYKVWLTPATAFDPAGCANNFGFCSGNIKTDNFKVEAGPTAGYVSVCKFEDTNGSGEKDGTEPFITGWPITATGVDNGPVTAQTGINGCVTFTYSGTAASSVVTLTEGSLGSAWTQTAPAGVTCQLGGTTPNGSACTFASVTGGTEIRVTLVKGDNVSAPDFGNQPCDPAVCNPVKQLVVTKTAAPRVTRKYTWQIEKKADTDLVKTAGAAEVGYQVTLTHDGGTPIGWQVTGSIRVSNPGTTAITGVNVTDAVNNGGTCEVVAGTDVTIPAEGFEDFDYACTYAAAPTALIGTNKATASVGGESFSGSANFDFATAVVDAVDDTVTVIDTLDGGTPTVIGTAAVGGANPIAIAYKTTYTDPAGTCTEHVNMASFETTDDNNDTDARGKSADVKVKVCVGADLTVTKTAVPTFKREYFWNIEKSATPTLLSTSAATGSFAYTVSVSSIGYVDGNHAVSGTISVTNPNDWQSVDVLLVDVIAGATCTVTPTSLTVPASSTATATYACALTDGTGGVNTAKAGWDATTAFTPTDTATGTAPFTFVTPTTTVNGTVTVIDTQNGTETVLGTVSAAAAAPFTYTRALANTTGGKCTSYENVATIKETMQSATAKVTICNPATGAKTIGFWQNRNGQGIIAASSGPNCQALRTYLNAFAPFDDLTATTCAGVQKYVMDVIKAATAAGPTMNAMLKAQMLATALDVYFSDPALGGNQIRAALPIGSVSIDLTRVNKPIGSTTFYDVSEAFGGATTMTVSQMLTHAAGQAWSGYGGLLMWYGDVKSLQEKAKDAFDAINNNVAAIAP